MGRRLAYKLFAWAVVATLAAFAVDLGLNRLGWANTPSAEVEAVITISLMVFLFLLARKLVMRPLKSVEHMAERISSGDLTARVHEDSSAEMAILSGTLNSMAEKLAESYDKLRSYNVTLEKTVEERTLDLARERNKLSAIFRGIPDGVVFLSSDGVIVEANPVMDRSFDLELSGFIGRRVLDLPEGGVKEALSYGTGQCAEAREFSFGERAYKVGCTTLPGGAGDMSGYIITFYDVTEEKLLEKRKADFVSLITHDLKSPLTSILGYAELMLDGGQGGLGAKERDYVRSIDDSGRRLLDMVEQYLDLTKMEAGMLRMDLAPVPPGEILKEAVSGLDVQAAQKGVSLGLTVGDGLPEVVADREKMSRVVTNLVSNGIKYTPPGGAVSVTGRECLDGRGGRWFEIEVRDNGHGIPAEDLARIFDRYYRSGWSSSIKGSGLGLAVVKSLVELHQGEVTVESAPGKGSVFTVRIPYTR